MLSNDPGEIKIILVTGVCGFLGSHIAKMLLKNKYHVIGVKRKKSDIRRIKKHVDQIKMIDSDGEDFSSKISNLHVDCIVHVATNYGKNNELVSEIIFDNLIFPLKVLELIDKRYLKLFINTDTFSNNSKKDNNHLKEYSETKKNLNDWLELLLKNYRFKLVTMKLQHVYGVDDREDKFNTWLINEVVAQKENIKLTKGLQQRDFISVDDVSSAFIAVINNFKDLNKLVTEFDVGSGKIITIKGFVLLVFDKYKSVTGQVSRINADFGAFKYREGEIMTVNPDTNGLYSLGWKPEEHLENFIYESIKLKINKT